MNEIARQLLVCLVAAHFIGDFILQGGKEAVIKLNIFVLLRHSFIVAALSYAICGSWTIWEIPIPVLNSEKKTSLKPIPKSQQNVSRYVGNISMTVHDWNTNKGYC